MNTKKPVCELVGTNGNVFALIGTVTKCLRRSGQGEKIKELRERALKCESYDAVLQLISEYVEVV